MKKSKSNKKNSKKSNKKKNDKIYYSKSYSLGGPILRNYPRKALSK